MQLVVVVVSVADGHGLLPVLDVRIERIAEMLAAAVGVGVGPDGRAQQGEPQLIAHAVVAELGFVDKAEAVLRVADIGPALGAYFKLRLLPGVARGGALDGAVGNFVRGEGVGG